MKPTPRALPLALAILAPHIASTSSVLAQCDEGKVFAPDAGLQDQFGRSVALDGQRMLVGAPWHHAHGSWPVPGAAYVYERSGAGWTAGTELEYPNPRDDDFFGFSVSLSGDYALVGAYGREHSDVWHAGAVYSFQRTGSSWQFHQRLVAADPSVNDSFGWAVRVDGDIALIASRGVHAYVFQRIAGTWQQVERFDPDGITSSGLFGESLALAGDYALVGDPGDSCSGVDGGAVSVYQRHSGIWSFQTKLIASDALALDMFGTAVDFDGSTAVIGARLADDLGSASGKAYVFRLDPGSVWTEVQKLLGSDESADFGFGSSVAVRGKRIVVGAPMGGYVTSTGAAYLFEEQDGSWVEIAKLVDPSAGDECHFGGAVDLRPDAMAIGAPGDGDGTIKHGAVTSFDPRGHAETYCAVNPNSSGFPALIGWQGSTSVSANNFTLSVASCPPSQFGLFYYGPDQLELPFGDGFRCVGGNVVRLPVLLTDAAGSASYHLDLQNPPSESARIEAGRTRGFQFWFRDPTGGPSAFNLSDALLATFCY